MTTRICDNLFKGIFIILLFIVLMLQTLLVEGQPFRTSQKSPYKGFVAAFGTHSATLVSNITAIDQSRLLQAGGAVGFIYGNAVLRAKANILGYYSSTGNTPGTIDLYTSNAGVNFYPLALVLTSAPVINPYLTGSVGYDQYKFFGYYANQETSSINYSQTQAPYIGKLKQVNATLGLGVDVALKDEYDFIHIFSEVRYGRNLSGEASTATLSHTGIEDRTEITVGLTFGMHR